jgi:hypothetical protein
MFEPQSPLAAARCRTAFTNKNYDEFESQMHIVSRRGTSFNGAMMPTDAPSLHVSEAMSRRRVTSHQTPGPQSVAKMKARQSTKIREIAHALISAGFSTIDAQAKILGVCRSTAWTILNSTHKGSGLSPKVISRILAVRQLPPLVRTKVLEYVEEKASGRYGHSARLRRKFITALSTRHIDMARGATAAKPASYARPRAADQASDPVDFSHKPSRSRHAV